MTADARFEGTVRAATELAPEEAELWPSLGEYPVYDAFLYSRMVHDVSRNERFRLAIAATVPGKSVVEIGTGADMLWAQAAAEAGATRVYAIEELDHSYARARETLRASRWTDRIHLIHGNALAVELAERVDVCVSEIIGSVGTAEGAATVLADARRRFLKADGMVIPRRCKTFIAAVELPLHLSERPAFALAAEPYVDELDSLFGGRCNLRLTLVGATAGQLLTSPAVVEDIDFEGGGAVADRTPAELIVSRAGMMHGFLLWIELHVGESEPLDSLQERTSWAPLFVPAFYPGVSVVSGDTVSLTWKHTVSDDGVHPDYAVWGLLSTRASGQIHGFDAPLPYVPRLQVTPALGLRRGPFEAARGFPSPP